MLSAARVFVILERRCGLQYLHGRVYRHGSPGGRVIDVSAACMFDDVVLVLSGVRSMQLYTCASWRTSMRRKVRALLCCTVSTALMCWCGAGNLTDLRVHMWTPCHSTPFYSMVHHNIDMQFLDCSPEPQLLGTDETSRFRSDPVRLLQGKYSGKEPEWEVPSHVFVYDRDFERVRGLAAALGLQEVRRPTASCLQGLA